MLIQQVDVNIIPRLNKIFTHTGCCKKNIYRFEKHAHRILGNSTPCNEIVSFC